MFLELIATFVAGIAAAGVMLLLNMGMGGRLPRWLIPVAAGAAMIVATISNEYSWYGRTTSNLPPEIVVAQRVESKAIYRPWTYLHPFVTRFMAADTASIRTNAAVPDQKMADLLFFGRWAPVQARPVLVDCANRRQAPLTPGATFDETGQVTDANWSALATEHGLFEVLCAEVD